MKLRVSLECGEDVGVVRDLGELVKHCEGEWGFPHFADLSPYRISQRPRLLHPELFRGMGQRHYSVSDEAHVPVLNSRLILEVQAS
ncbi:MAG: hypothetical protein QXM21_05705 [Candidatus Caldarchaeum sp.]